MITGIDITFFEVDKPQEVKEGKLFITEEESYLEFNDSLSPEAFESIKAVYAKGRNSDEKYTLVNCTFKGTNFSLYRYTVNEVYKGDHIANVVECDCLEIEARMTGLTNWINQPRLIPKLTFSADQSSQVIMEKPLISSYRITENIQLELCQFSHGKFDKNEIILRNQSSVKFIASNPVSRLEMYKNVIAFLELLSIFTNNLPQLTHLNFHFNGNKAVEYLNLKKLNAPDTNEALLTLDNTEPDWAEALVIFYSKLDKFVQVLNLLIASVKNITPEISFLNITTAFEVFHKSFHEQDNEIVRKELLKELQAAGLVKQKTANWDQIIRYQHLFKLVEHIDFFKQNFPNQLSTIALIRASRNYYTHYSEPKDKIWTPNQLLFANRLLQRLLKGVLLKELKISDKSINKLLNNRAALFYQDYEKNKYSLSYLAT